MTDDYFEVGLGSMVALLGLVLLPYGTYKSGSLGLMLLGISMAGRGLHIGSSTLWTGVALLGLVFNLYALVTRPRSRD